jgi:LCP family protein required for cell wall assembly
MNKWKIASIVLILALYTIIGFYGYVFLSFINDTPDDSRFKQFVELQPNKEDDKAGQSLLPYDEPEWKGQERVNILLIGGDSRGLSKYEIPRSDTLMIASIDPLTERAHLFSLLRDTYVKIPGHGSERVNVAVVLGGPQLAMQTVSQLTGLDIHYYIYTDFYGFVHLIDEIGGIEFDVEKDMYYSSIADGPEYDINLKKGWQLLDGASALQYVRYRGDAASDFARTERQRKFMTALAEKLQSTSSILRLPLILHKMDPYIESNINAGEMIKLGTLGFNAKSNEIVELQLPPSKLLQETRRGGASVIAVDPDELQSYIRKQLADTDPTAKQEGTAHATGQ